jgi:hypothetical protein
MSITQLYRHYDREGALLYVGISLSAVGRLAVSDWFKDIVRIEIESFPNRRAAIIAESKAIATEHPKHNVMGRMGVQSDNKNPALDDLNRRLVNLNPVYSIEGAAALLNVKTSVLRNLVASCLIGSITQPNGKHKPKIQITGWQIIEYLESLGGVR